MDSIDGYIHSMGDIWPQREKFKSRLKEFQARTGMKQMEFAQAIGYPSLLTLRNNLYYPNRRIQLAELQAACKLFDCSITEFIDDPGATIAGQPMDELSEKGRFLAGLIYDQFKSPDLNDDDRELLYKEWLQKVEQVRAIKARYERNAHGPTN